jgi:hypothetical protein
MNCTLLYKKRKGETIPNPKADAKMLLGDRVICFWSLDKIKKRDGRR